MSNTLDMQSKHLARWLQDHTEMLGSIDDAADQAFHTALYEGIIDLALYGDSRLVDSVVESAAAHAVATGRALTDLLGVHQRLRLRAWNRIGEEIDPEPAFAMLFALDAIFVHIIRVTIDVYQEATQLATAAKSTEIARRYSESEQKVMQYAAEVARANRELARLDQAKTDFIGIAAHELKTPLTLIRGYVNFLRDLASDSQSQQLIEGIDRGTLRINSILEDMLDLSSIDMKRLSLALETVNLKRLISLVISHSQNALSERQQTITVEKLDTLPNVEADSNRLYQVFKQIVSNAVKYTPDGGCIMVSGQALPEHGQDFSYVRIIIADTGVGIAPEDREKIFEKFYRSGNSALHSTGETKFMGAGPGLGLAIVKGLVEAHGGRVSAESPGYDTQNFPGSRIIVELPVRARPRSDVKTSWVGPKK